MAPQKPVKSLIIGCGGSGIRTLTRLNELLASNYEWRHRLQQDMFYMAVDTQKSMLDRFEADIRKQMGRSDLPYIARVHLSEGLVYLNDFIKPYFDDCSDANIEALKKHWWHDPDDADAAFRAPLIFPLQEGAGQCPIAAYGLAWYRMKKIGDAVTKVIDAVVARGDADPNQLTNLNVIIVTSLAGGTGRGCWNMLTFKIRQYIKTKYEKEVTPLGVFFDVSCFQDTPGTQSGNQQRDMKVNALTGLSELSCWMRMARNVPLNVKCDYRLPNMRTPTDEKTDVLNTNSEETRNVFHRTPVNNAYIICRSNGVAFLANNNSYHEMAGSGLYARIINSEVTGNVINDPAPFLSMAAATFEIDATNLRTYFENAARIAAAKMLVASDSEYDKVDDNGKSPRASDVAAFFEEIPLDVAVESVASISPAERSTCIRRLFNEFKPECRTRTDNFIRDAFKHEPDKKSKTGRESLEDAQTAGRTVCSFLPAEDVKKAFDKVFGVKIAEALKAHKAGDLESFIRAKMMHIYKGDGKTPSIKRAKAYLSAINAKLRNCRDKLPETLYVDNGAMEAGQKSAEDYLVSEIDKAWKNTRLWDFSRFSRREKETLVRMAENAFYAENYPAVRKLLVAQINTVVGIIAGLKRALDTLAGMLDVVIESFEGERRASAGLSTDTTTDPHDELFVNDTPEKIRAALGSPDQLSRFYKRILKPIKTREEVNNLAAKSITFPKAVHDRLAETLDAIIISQSDPENRPEDDDPRILRDKLANAIRQRIQLPDTFLTDNFKFKNVLSQNCRKWNEHIRDNQGGMEERQQLFKHFERFLGVKPERDPATREYMLPDVDTIIESISISMVKACLPWWELDRKVDEIELQAVTILLPMDLTGRAQAFAQKIQDSVKIVKPDILHERNSNGGVTPFHIATFASESILPEVGVHEFDKIRGWSYNEPDVKKWLGWAEREDGKSVFYQGENNRGIGYISPVFVRDARFRDNRWNPWVEKAKQKSAEEVQDDTANLLVYAMLGNGNEDPSLAQRIQQDFALDLPLLKYESKGKKFILARKTRIPGSTRKWVDDPDCEWKADTRLVPGIDNIFAYFATSGGDAKGTLPREVKNPKKVSERIKAEAAAFDKNVKGRLGQNFDDLVEGFGAWLQAQRQSETEAAKVECWNRLIKAAGKLVK